MNKEKLRIMKALSKKLKKISEFRMLTLFLSFSLLINCTEINKNRRIYFLTQIN